MSRGRRGGAALVFAAVGAAYLWLLSGFSPAAYGESPGSYWTTMGVLAVPGALAAALLWTAWRRRAAATTSTLDAPARLVATAAATLPADRRDWGSAMVAELAHVQGSRDRWRFALGCLRTAVLPPQGQRVPVLVVVGVAVVAVAGTAYAVGRALPEMRFFAVTFVGLVGVFISVAVSRARRPTPLAPVSVVGLAGVPGSVAIVAYYLATDVSEAPGPFASVALAVVLAGCLWLAVAPPRSMTTSRPARWASVAAGLAVAVGVLAVARQGTIEDGPHLLFYLVGAPVAAMLLASAFVAFVDRSFRAGLQAAIWTVVATFLLTFCTYVVEDARFGRATGVSLLDGEATGAGRLALQDAVVWVLAFQFVWVVPFGVLGAGLGAVIARNSHRGSGAAETARL